MNHLFTPEFQHITLLYLPVEDIKIVMLICKKMIDIVNHSSKFDHAKKYSFNFIKFQYVVENIKEPITTKALDMMTQTNDIYQCINKINKSYVRGFIDYHFVTDVLFTDFKNEIIRQVFTDSYTHKYDKSLLFYKNKFNEIFYPQETDLDLDDDDEVYNDRIKRQKEILKELK